MLFNLNSSFLVIKYLQSYLIFELFYSSDNNYLLHWSVEAADAKLQVTSYEMNEISGYSNAVNGPRGRSHEGNGVSEVHMKGMGLVGIYMM